MIDAAAEDERIKPLQGRPPFWPDDYDAASRLVVSLTGGAIRNGYIRVPKSQRLFPAESVGDDDDSVRRFNLLLPGGGSVETFVLRKRGRIRARFNGLFASEKLAAGDRAIISRLSDSDYRLTFARQGEPLPDSLPPASVTAEETTLEQAPLNQILFGPPGTGKTYATVDRALEILDPEFLSAHSGRDASTRERLKRRYDELAREGRVRFVTFHQSFSYEDFVEGLRAETDDATGQIRYEVVDGVFKRLCDAAAVKVSGPAEAPVDLGGRRIWKMSLGNIHGSDAGIYDECIDGGYVLLGWGGPIDFSGCRTREDVRQRFVQAGREPVGATDYGVTSVTTFVTRMKPGDLVVVTDGNFKFRAIGEISGDYAFRPHPDYPDDYSQSRPVKWLRRYEPSLPHTELMNNQFSQMSLYELRPGAIDMERLAALLANDEVAGDGAHQARVLVIDEINRGNVSRIFGELITLIEPSKRAGASEALEVVLPYSKERFSVPDNVYLIGTMNTADRSLAGLDVALRRRFVFREMPPRPELLDGVSVAGVDMGRLLRTLNQRIEVLLDREHCLGHAYFMPLAADPSLERLAGIFRDQILPLLQEYFFEDWQRIQWVLNDHRKPAPLDRFVDQVGYAVQDLFGEEANVPEHQRPWRINERAFARPTAYAGIISAAREPAEPARATEDEAAEA